ncbi:DUF7683 domain-containing protein [Rhodococcus ruber]|uniref:DUF7683 domain-containing protein n=1 Tax=Rhodococcus ruber TaxID=1830 RepID=UPI003B20E8B2
MWHLEKFDKTTHLLMGEYVLHDMSAAVVGRILGIADDENELPIGIRQHDVPLSKASEFAAFPERSLHSGREMRVQSWLFFRLTITNNTSCSVDLGIVIALVGSQSQCPHLSDERPPDDRPHRTGNRRYLFVCTYRHGVRMHTRNGHRLDKFDPVTGDMQKRRCPAENHGDDK